MRDIYILYGFMLLMAVNLVASFLYLVGFNQLRLSLRRAFRRQLRP